MAAQMAGSWRNGQAAGLGGRRGARRDRCLYQGCFRGRVARRTRALQLGGCPRAVLPPTENPRDMSTASSVSTADSLTVCGEKNGRHFMMEVLEGWRGGGGGAEELLTLFIFVLLSLNCSQSPVLFLGCHN